MKKIYASMIALAMGAFITAGARTYQCANINFDGVSVKHFETVGEMQSAKTVNANAIKKVKANANDEWISLGEGTFYEGIFGVGEVKVEVFENSITANYYQVPGAFTEVNPEAYPLLIDATDPTNVIIPEQETNLNVTFTLQDGSQLQGPLTILSFSEYAQINGLTKEDLYAMYPEMVIDMTDGVINIPESAILGIVGTSQSLIMINDEMYLALPGSTFVPEWGETRTTQMLEGFFSVMFLEEPNHNPIEVNIQKNNKKEGVYRIVNPWLNLGFDGAPFVFDMSDPTCVVADPQSSGVTVNGRGITVIANECGMFYNTIEDFKAALLTGEADSPWTYDATTKKISIPAPYGLFFNWPEWTGNEYNAYYTSGAFDSWIAVPDFTGISSVAVDNNDAKAEYYNIQGVRVNNPVAGQLYIVKKGNQVSKQVIR